MAHRLFRIANGVMAVLLLYAAVVQYNDPDPLAWMLIYGLGAVACLRVVARRPGWFLATAVGSVALGWAAVLVPRVLAQPPPVDALLTYRMLNVGVEEAREMLGLSILGLWMAVIAIVQRPRSQVEVR